VPRAETSGNERNPAGRKTATKCNRHATPALPSRRSATTLRACRRLARGRSCSVRRPPH
jgi:hypothetical protein